MNHILGATLTDRVVSIISQIVRFCATLGTAGLQIFPRERIFRAVSTEYFLTRVNEYSRLRVLVYVTGDVHCKLRLSIT